MEEDVCKTFTNKLKKAVVNRDLYIDVNYDKEKGLCIINFYDSTSERLAKERGAPMATILSYVGYDPQRKIVVNYDLNRIVPGRFFEAEKTNNIVVDFKYARVETYGKEMSVDDFMKLFTNFFSQ